MAGHFGGWTAGVRERQRDTSCREREFGYRVYLVGYGGERERGKAEKREEQRERKRNGVGDEGKQWC